MTRTGRSEIHGIGVFATRAIRAGEDITGCVSSDAAGFNHSCSPNVRIGSEWLPPYQNHLGGLTFRRSLVALREIAPGEELTSRYGFPIDFKCACPAHRAIMRLAG